VNRIWAIAFKDLRATARNRPALAMMLVAPLVLAALLGLAFGGGSGFSVPATKLAVANGDGSSGAGALVVGILQSHGLADLLTVRQRPTAAAARKAVSDGTADVALLIPAKFSDALYGASPNARTVLELYENPTDQIGGAIAESVVEQTLLELNGSRAAAQAAASLALSHGQPGRAVAAARSAAQTFVARGGIDSGFSVVARSPELPGHKKTRNVGVTASILVGMSIFFMFFGASNVARTILDEDRAGTLARLFTTPTPRRTILGGKYASVYLTVLVQATILLVAGRLLFGIDWGELSAVAALTVVAAAVAAALALLVIASVRTPAQAGAIGAGVYLVLALLGGNFTGSTQSSGVYATVQKLTPNGWLLQGWDTVLRGGSLTDIVSNLVIPLLFAAVFFSFVVVRFRRRFA
jgi:ABC-2 type transport system permease protein